MTKIAIDIALLPPSHIMDKIIRLNQTLSHKSMTHFLMNKKNCLPHITLAMGAVTQSDLPKIRKALRTGFNGKKSIPIKVSAIKNSFSPIHKWNAWLRVDKTKSLQMVHEQVMQIMTPFFTNDAHISMFYSPPKMTQLPVFWLLNFHKTSVHEKYKPHITIGKGKTLKGMIHTPFSFKASRITVCHLGSHCTCRKILCNQKLE